jgi:hypothetical protein
MFRSAAGSSVVGNGANNRLHVTPVVAGLLAVTAVSAVVAGVVMCALRVRSRRHTDQRRVDVHGGMGTGSIMGGGAGGGAAVIAVCKQKADGDDYAAAALDPDKNPDLIPPTKVKGECATRTRRLPSRREEQSTFYLFSVVVGNLVVEPTNNVC